MKFGPDAHGIIRSVATFLRGLDVGLRRRMLLCVAASIGAIWAGFVAVGPKTAEHLISGYGYYYILGLFALFVGFALRVARTRGAAWGQWLRRPGWAGIAILLGAGITVWADPLKHKILYDEYVLQGTAEQMHANKEVGTPVRAYNISGTWVSVDTFLDKRPYFFAFLVSLLHDVTGYRAANMFALNIALAPVFLALVYWLARASTGTRAPAILALALLATLPLLGQQVTGAGMELHNLSMLALVMTLAVLYLRVPSDDRLALLVCGALLLSQSRYESVIFILPTALVIVLGWVRAKHIFLPWPAIIAPLLLVPYAWHNRVLSAKPTLWQLREGETSRFGVSYLSGNLRGAGKFFFNTTVELANSWWLSALGAVALGWILVRAIRWALHPSRRKLEQVEFVFLVFGAGIFGNLIMLMFYYWSRLDEVIASRFALPCYFFLALLSAIFVRDLDLRRLPGTRLAAAGLGIWFFVFALPAVARRPYTDHNLVMHEVDWTREIVAARGRSVLLITNSSTIPFILDRIPTVLIGVAGARSAQIRYHLGEGTFREAIVAQAIRPISSEGETGVDPADLLPPSFHLETIIQKRFGGRWLRISRLVSIDADNPAPNPLRASTVSPP